MSHSDEQTRRLGRRLGELVEPGAVVLLSGELGSGKTCFVQGLAVGLGVDAPVTSPTFTLANEYRGRIRLYHMDFYRLDRPDEIHELGFDEYFYGDGVSVAEWPEHVAGLPPEHLIVRFKVIAETKRALRFEPHGGRYVRYVEVIRRVAYLV